MRRIIAILIATLVLPSISVSASDTPFDFFIDEEVVIHPDETVQFRIAWHNIVGEERHFAIYLNNSRVFDLRCVKSVHCLYTI